jgi:hypothetical protein
MEYWNNVVLPFNFNMRTKTPIIHILEDKYTMGLNYKLGLGVIMYHDPNDS